MERDQSNDEGRTSEPVTESPAQEYFLPNHADGFIKLEYDVSNQECLDDEPPSRSLAQERLPSENQEGQDSSVTAAVRRVLDHDHGQTAVSFPPGTTSRPVNMVLEECSYSPQPDGLSQEPREQPPTAGRPESQQPQFGNLNQSSGYSWQANIVSQTWDASVRDSSSGNGQRRAESGLTHAKDHSRAGQPVLDQAPRINGPGATVDTQSHEGNVLAPLQMTGPPSSEIPSPHDNQEQRLPPIENISLPPIPEVVNPSISRWRLRPNYQWSGYLPDIYESRRFEVQTASGQPRRLVRGPTQPLGPPMKPFDEQRSEERAREQWRRVMRDREICEVEELSKS